MVGVFEGVKLDLRDVGVKLETKAIFVDGAEALLGKELWR